MDKLSAGQRDGIYIALGLVNAVMVACTQQQLLPDGYAHVAGLISLICFAMMKEVGAK